MTKKQKIIQELHEHGECWANESYTTEQLEGYLDDLVKAESMTDEELLAHIRGKEGEQR